MDIVLSKNGVICAVFKISHVQNLFYYDYLEILKWEHKTIKHH